MGGGSKKQTVGYWYKLLYHAGLSKGPIDAFLEFRGGDRTAWKGELAASGTITIDKPKLWGGTEEQGGIVSDVDVMFGEATQAPNAYLLANLGDQVPAWRGLATLVFKGGKYGAMNPYPQKASYKIRKIKQGWDGDCWYPETAEIVVEPGVLFTDDLAFNAQLATLDGSIAGIELTSGFSDQDTLIIDKPAGLTYQAWSYWASAGEAPADGLEWANALWVTDGHGTTTQHWGGSTIVGPSEPVDERYATAAEAEAAMARRRIILSGSTFYRLWLYDIPPTDNRGGISVRIYKNGVIAMNPAHILYFARSNSDLGREPIANINDASLTAAADRLYDEGFGICTTRDPAAESVEEFEQRICKLIDGAFSRDPITGQWHLDLARGDYVLDDLPILTDDDILEFKELPSTLDNAVNSVSVKYFDPEKKETITTPPVQARALIAQFGTIHQTIDYPEIPTADLAVRVALRELRATATPTRALELVCTRKPGAWRVNTYFRLQVPKRGIADMVCIVGEKQSGNLKSGAIRLKATQDIYSMPATAFVDIEPGVDTAPPQAPLAITAQAAFEAPYTEVVTALPRAELAALPADVGYLMAVAADPARSTNYTVMVDAGAGYTETATGDWAPTATVVEASGYDDVAFTLASGSRLDEVVVGSAALWGTEIVRIDALDIVTGALTVARGCADTVPVAHAAGERIWFYGDSAASDETEYTDGETVAVKLLTNTGSQQLDVAAATAMPVTFDSRLMRPYPPGKLRINGASYPDYIEGAYSLSWAHRDRIAQADQLIDTEVASIGPETGTTYTLRLYGETDTLLRTETGMTGTSYTWTAEEADSGLTVPGSASASDYATEVAADSPAAWWRLDETSGTSAADSSGNGLTGDYGTTVALNQAPLIVSGKSVSAAGAAVGNEAVDAPNIAASTVLSAEIWIKAAAAPAADRAFLGGIRSGFWPRWWLYMGADGKVRAGLYNQNSSSGSVTVTSPASLANGVRHKIGFAWDKSGDQKVHLYVDGVQVAESAAWNQTIWAGSSHRTQIYQAGSETIQFDEASVYLSYLSPARMQAHYNAGAIGVGADAPRLNNRVRCELESVRGGLVSGQKHDVTVIRVGYGYSYGYSYGGL